MRSLTFPVLFAVLSCGPPTRVESIEIVEVVAVDDVECTLTDDVRESGVLDLSLGDLYFAPVRFAAFVNGDATDARAGVATSRVFFTANADLSLPTTPQSADDAFVAGVGGVTDTNTPNDIAFATMMNPVVVA